MQITEKGIVIGSGESKSKLAWKLVLPVIIVLLAIDVALLLFLRPHTNSTTSTSSKAHLSQQQAAQVAVRANAFMPATIRVTKGTTIVWTNQDSTTHQVATDPFPQEDGLAGFVDATALLPGDSYSFTFNQAGTFTYHDHLHPELQATVIVTK